MPSGRALRIPNELDGPIKELIALDDATLSQLEQAIGNVSAAFYPSSFASAVASKIDYDGQRIESIIRLLVTFYAVRAAGSVAIPDFAEHVVEALDTKEDPSLNLSGSVRTDFKNKLVRLLRFDTTLGITSKAIDIMNQHERVYCSGTRILTDLRPIFSEDTEQKPSAAVIIHMLKLAYHEGETTKDIFVALDSQDIQSLREQLDRAERKARGLLSVFDLAGIQNLSQEA